MAAADFKDFASKSKIWIITSKFQIAESVDYLKPTKMEHWQKMLVGVSGGTVLTIFFFYFIFDKLLKTFRMNSGANTNRSSSVPIPMVTRSKNGR